MRKKSSFSEENVLVSSNPKLSEYLRQNPRLPKKMKTLKSKYVNPTVRTVGQLSSGGKQLATIFGSQNVFRGEPDRGESNRTNLIGKKSWTNLNRTFSQNRSPRCSPRTLLDPGDYSLSKRSWSARCDNHNSNPFCVVSDAEHQTELLSENELQAESATLPVSLNRKTSENGVQVNMFHCKECRRHIKYGKDFKNETSCTESDTESNLFLVTCTSCKRKEGMNRSENREGNSAENNERGDGSLKYNISPQSCVPTLCNRENTLDYNILTPRTEISSMDGEIPHVDNLTSKVTYPQTIGEIPHGDNLPPKVTFLQTIGGKIWLPEIKFVTVAILIVSAVLYFTEFNYFGATISSINIYLRNLMLQEEIEEKLSVFDWVTYMLFNVQEYVKPRPLFLYLF